MIISLGIESTAHTFSIGIVDENGNVYSNERVIYKTEKGGIHPREAAELHSKEAINVLKKALDKAGFIKIKDSGKYSFVDALYEIKRYLEDKHTVFERFHSEPWNRYRYLILENDITVWIENQRIKSNDEKLEKELNDYFKGLNMFERKINLISFSAGPGLYPTLVQANFYAKLLSELLNIEKIGVNHLIAHVEIVKLYNNFKDPVILLVTGANTMVLAFEGGKYRIFGETLDMGVGNFFDKVGRLLNIGFPAGPVLEKLAEQGKNIIDLPYSVKGMDIQLGGLYTYIKNLVGKNNVDIKDLAYSIQEHVFSMLAEISERAIAHLNKKEFGLTGGVAANKRLQRILRDMCRERNVIFGTVPMDFANDNGAMIAWTGIVWYKNGIEGKDIIDPYWRPESINYKI